MMFYQSVFRKKREGDKGMRRFTEKERRRKTGESIGASIRRRLWKIDAAKRLAEQAKRLRLEPEGVMVMANREFVEVQICKGKDFGLGIAVCSVTDACDFSKGMELATDRAFKALKDQKDSEPIRKRFEDFPPDWTKAQMERLMNIGAEYKSAYFKGVCG